MKSVHRRMQLLTPWRPQWTLAVLALVGFITAPALRILAEVSLELAEISLGLCHMGLVVLRVCGI